MGIEIRPAKRWVLAAAALAGICWLVLLALGYFSWPSAGWIGRAILVWLFLVSVAVSAFVLSGWKRLSVITDEAHVRFGRRSILRSDLSEIKTGPVATSATQFWVGVAVMALSQDFTRTVYFRAADGRALLEIPDLYGSARLADLAAYLRIPFVDSYTIGKKGIGKR